MRHLVVSLAVICAVICDGWAQNRGSARYLPPEDYDGESTRAPRPAPTRGSSLRRQRPTKAPEPPVIEDELKAYQPPQSPGRTTGRRVPQRENTQQVAPPPPPPVPVEEPAPLHPVLGSDTPQSPQTEPEGRPQGTRRRRPKKRRRPQSIVPKVDEEPDKQVLAVPEKDKIAISELLNDDQKRTEEFQGNFQSRNAPSNFDSDSNYNTEKATWGSNEPAEQPQSNDAGPQYFRPQPAINRLPIGDSDPVSNSRRYKESPSTDPQNEFIPKGPPSSIRNEASYIPVLTPIRVPSEGASRLPLEDYTATRNKDSTRHNLLSGQNIPFRSHGNISPGPDPDENVRNTGSKPLQNIIPQPNEPNVPVRGHSDIRLPEDDQPLLSSEYDPSNFDSATGLPVPLEPNTRTSEEGEDPASPTNRLPNPSEVHYDSVYPEYLDSRSHSSQRIAGRRQEHGENDARNTHPSYGNARRESGTKPQEYDNDAEVDRQQASQYRPPLQRTSSRYKPEDFEESTRSRSPQTPSPPIPRGRGSSRHQSSIDETAPERTRSSTSHQSEPSDVPSRTRSTSTSQSSTRRVPQRYAPETVENAPRTSSRRQSESANTFRRDAGYTPSSPAYVPIDEISKSEQRSPPPSSRVPNQSPSELRLTEDQQEYGSIRNTLRSRPQYEVKDVEPTSDYDESVEDPNTYSPEYHAPSQPETRGRPNQRTPVLRHQPPQPEYQVPSTRQQNRQESNHESPQNPRYRHQPQYQASQDPRAVSRQPSARQNPPVSRQQARPQHQESEPPAARGRPRSNFKCPDSIGFFADPVQCDKYYECRNGTAEMSFCGDGLAFNEISAPKFLRCDSLRDVDCKSRPELQEPQPTKNCPRRFGLFQHETDCTKFWNCVDGAATEVQCPPGLTYNDVKAACDWADLTESSCKTEDLLGFTCPEPTAYDLQDGVYTGYPHPSNCQLHFTCIKGADGQRRPRMLSCNEGLVFDPQSASCTRPEDVPGCEEFYGPRPPPRRKPAARQPAPREPEEELIEEEPTPRPRRRGSSNRTPTHRTRN